MKPTLETIIEATSSVEKGSEGVALSPFYDAPIEDTPKFTEPIKSFTSTNLGDEIPEFEETLANDMWEGV
ncbi:hypothetical protein GOP47_0005449 [Adiantum capillus-veneris]|uniref:Uncharacterized protein n=1 Tax=Adiantum capillus-veneris TaxID=13818 RepID=A0A9D4V5R3_ADICA|nr:hypothetical protein GOP47_0005449 [Adiantum capillus-veneris]